MKLTPEERTKYATIMAHIYNNEWVPKEDFVWATAIQRKGRRKYDLAAIKSRNRLNSKPHDIVYHGYNTGPR